MELLRRAVGAMAVSAVVLAVGGASVPAGAAESDRAFDEAVDAVLDLPYDPGYLPTGTDAAFGDDDFPAAFPGTDTSTGSCCVGPVPDQPPLADLAPPFPQFPDGFELVELASYDGTPLHAFVGIHDGAPGVVVMHGFNSNGKWSVVRYAAALYANGFSVIAPDHRDVGREWERGGSWHPDGRRGQGLGWKESQDLLVAAEELRDRGAPRVGVLGFSEGAQNTILALGQDLDGVVDAVLTFSGPADQATLADRSPATTAALLTTVVNEPDLCAYLDGVGQLPEFSASPNFLLRHASAVHTLDGGIAAGVDPDVPGLHLYAGDDELVPSWNATVLASRTAAMARQRTVLVDAGNHAYFYDRWWTEAAALTWFRTWLDPNGATTVEPTVAAPRNGTPLRTQAEVLDATTPAEGDAELSDPDLCPAASEPVGPTPLLEATADGAEVVADGRRSWSGWDDHRVVAWELDLGDGRQAAGDDLADARVAHTYRRGGTYDVTLTVTDDTGRTASVTETVEVSGAPGPTPAPRPAPAVPPAPPSPGPGGSAGGDLPSTGGGAGLVAVALLALARRGRPRSR